MEYAWLVSQMGNHPMDNYANIKFNRLEIDDMIRLVSLYVSDNAPRIKDTVDNNVTITIASDAGNRYDASGNKIVEPYLAPTGFAETRFTNIVTNSANKQATMTGMQEVYRKIIVPHNTKQINVSGGCTVIPINYNTGVTTTDTLSIRSLTTQGFSTFTPKYGYIGSPDPGVPKGHMDFNATINGDFKAGDVIGVGVKIDFYMGLSNFDKSKFENKNVDCETIISRLNSAGFTPSASCRSPKIQLSWNVSC